MTMVVAVRQTATGEKAVLTAALEPLAGSANAFRRDVVARPTTSGTKQGEHEGSSGRQRSSVVLHHLLGKTQSIGFLFIGAKNPGPSSMCLSRSHADNQL